LKDSKFISEKISQSAIINLNGSIEIVFPLFGAFEERKWAEGWNPTLIYPDKEVIAEGTTFSTEGYDQEPEYLWRVSKYYPEKYLIQYLVSTQNRYWTITVKCFLKNEILTEAEITYTFIGLNEIGNEINKKSLERMYKHNLKDWEEEINNYLNKISVS
jgi:hypothetical protein